ncbi:SIS domain-containing protein [Yinghuangia seranimata]|uniref:SIS domain-containing protein n=1 Tax=Yinghuangia seranimata TaxID=408067 RepID=UPI00248CF0AC|nr:SIS domain-containing protein [Yinghuangia seranimata]MDI2129672.1 SIS domain-containing protein [Yinghuangia seranimata]
MTAGSPGSLMAAEMAEQPDVLARLLVRLPELGERMHTLRPEPLAGTVLVARGSSDNAAAFGRYLIEAASGRPTGLGSPSITTRYHAEVDYTGYLFVALSQSGRTPEIVTAAASARERGARVVAVTNDATGPLASVADLTVATDAGPELAVPATKTVTAQFLALAGLAAGLGSLPPALWAPAPELPDVVRLLLADPHRGEDLAAAWAHHDRLVVAGRGLGGAVAMEGALKIRETSGLFAEGISVADLLHGPIAALDHDVPVLLVDLGGPTSPDVAELRRRLASDGIPYADLALPHEAGELPEAARAVAATVRLQQLARAFALRRGWDPDRPRALSKVTATY